MNNDNIHGDEHLIFCNNCEELQKTIRALELKILSLKRVAGVGMVENNNEPEYCNVSGARLGKLQESIHPLQCTEQLPTCTEERHDWEFTDHGSAGFYTCLVCKRIYNEQARTAE